MKKTLKHKKLTSKNKKRMRLKGDVSPAVLAIILLIGIVSLGSVYAAQSINKVSKQMAKPTPTSAQSENAHLSMQTFYITPKPTATPTPVHSCSNSVTDTMLILDRSGSMNDGSLIGGSKITKTKAAANKFIDTVSANPQSRVGLTLFNDTSILAGSMTNDFAAIKNAVSGITAKGYTCIQCGIKIGNQDIAACNLCVNILILSLVSIDTGNLKNGMLYSDRLYGC